MTRTFKLAAIAAATIIAAPAFAAATMDANLELDTKLGNQGRGLSQGGRVEFNVAGKSGGDAGFVAGRASALLTRDGTAAVDDMWGQIGTSAVDVKFGRFEAAELFAVGKDVYVENDGVNGYRANFLRGRTGPVGTVPGTTNKYSPAHVAVNVNALPGVAFELGYVGSNQSDADIAAGTANAKGFRPTVSFNAGPATVVLGMESGKTGAGEKFTGFGGKVGFGVGGGTITLTGASGKLKVSNDKGTSMGLHAAFGPAGISFIADKATDGATGVSAKQNTIYAAYSLPLFATGATITPAYSYSKQKDDVTNPSAKSGFAVRVNYAF